MIDRDNDVSNLYKPVCVFYKSLCSWRNCINITSSVIGFAGNNYSAGRYSDLHWIILNLIDFMYRTPLKCFQNLRKGSHNCSTFLFVSFIFLTALLDKKLVTIYIYLLIATPLDHIIQEEKVWLVVFAIWSWFSFTHLNFL